MELILLPEAMQSLRKLPKADAKRLLEALQMVADQHPQRLSFVTEMVGTSGQDWRLRKGDYRALYHITDDAIIVFDIGGRKDIYR
ncbi:type II toxin-antitoxin system RelE family toxin [Acidisoma silvae]|uniref:Type II toxin-antitoxin system RelE/ParE family toxin n=1 Tax=Acidisoma silvae TaxID=2802396 RepID=A0A963YR31_9PROT|nr:type II toxin-antitoxin system RelE/ParE family toxin [Acidisoma silvae]MCB8875434.1 type II toxin-antitoxin system RelE/ParE family toxin [Acidisoma silvae]